MIRLLGLFALGAATTVEQPRRAKSFVRREDGAPWSSGGGGMGGLRLVWPAFKGSLNRAPPFLVFWFCLFVFFFFLGGGVFPNFETH